MRNFFLAFLLFAVQSLSAQIPQSFNYQAIARDADHLPLGNADITVKVQILRNGVVMYTETDQVTTAASGFFAIAVGKSNPADFQNIDWRLGNYELKVELSGALDLITPATPVLSVPYALIADEVLNEKQQLVLNGDQLSISGGNTVTLNNTGGVNQLADLNDVNTSGVSMGQVLQWNGAAWVPATVNAGGTFTAGPGIQITGNQVSNTGDINPNDDLLTTSQAGGDLSGAFADLQVKNGIIGTPELADGSVTAPKLAQMGASNGQVLKWNGSAWAPQNDIGGGNGDDWGNQSVNTDATLSGNGTPANALKIAQQNAVNGQYLKWNGSTWTPADVVVSSNTITSTQIVDNSITVNDLAPGTIPSTLPPSGPAAGDLSGIYPNPSVVAIKGRPVSNTSPLSGQVLKWDGAEWAPQNDDNNSGDNWGNQSVTTDSTLSGNGTVANPLIIAQQNALSGQFLKWNGITWLPADNIPGINSINSAQIVDNSITVNDFAAGVIPVTLPPNGAAGGDLSGFYPTPVVKNIQGHEVSSSNPTDGDILRYNGAIQKWEPVAQNVNTIGWDLNGNAGTDPASNFIGTTDHQPIVFKVNQIERMQLFEDGRLSLNNENKNTAIGYKAGTSNIGKQNVFLGYEAGFSNTIGNRNTAIGEQALFNNINGFDNCALGIGALVSNINGFNNIAIGNGSLSSNTSGVFNVSIGTNSLFSNMDGKFNVSIGDGSLWNNTSGRDNIGIGNSTLQSNSIGNNNVAVGNQALAGTGNGVSTYANTAIGTAALTFIETGSKNVAIGNGCMLFNKSGDNNVAIGNLALYHSEHINNIVAIGDSALHSNNGERNTAIGSKAMASNTIGQDNTSIGYQSLFHNNIGEHNTAIGSSALFSNTSGIENTAIGSCALCANLTGGANTGVGDGALAFNTSGNFNTALGNFALGDNLTGSSNIAIGTYSLLGHKTGNNNTAIGTNTSISDQGSFNTVLGSDCGTNTSILNNTTAIGYSSKTSASNTISIGNTSITSIKGQVGFTTYSDARIKTQIKDNIPGLAFIQKLRPVSYHYDNHRQNALMGIVDTAKWEGKYDIERKTFSGFIAQEVEQAAQSVGYDFSGLDAPANDKSLYGLRYAEFTVPLVKAVQEQQALIEAQKAELSELKQQLAMLNAQVQTLVQLSKPEKTEAKTETPK